MNSQRKGQKAENELANKLQSLGFNTWRSSAMYETGQDAPDIDGIEGLHVECKRVEKLNLSAAMSQSENDARCHEIPCVMHRKNREAWQVTVKLHDLHRLAEIINTQEVTV